MLAAMPRPAKYEAREGSGVHRLDTGAWDGAGDYRCVFYKMSWKGVN